MNVGIIGLGVGEAHIEGYQSHEACRVVSLCDFDNEKQSLAEKEYPSMRVVTDANEILTDADINAVSIASYDNYHCEHICTALDHGKHVFVEKPLCLSFDEMKKIAKSLDSNPGLVLSSNLILRKSPRFIALRERIQAGDLGSLYYVEGDYNYGRIWKITEGWRGQIPYYSVVYGGSIHLVDLLLWLTGDKVVEVQAAGTSIATSGTQYKYNDTICALLTFESGMIGKVTSNYSCVRPHFHSLQICGTEGTFINGENAASLYRSRDPEEPAEIISEPYPGVHKGDLLNDFITAIMEGRSPEIAPAEVFQSMSVCFAIEHAMNTGNKASVRDFEVS